MIAWVLAAAMSLIAFATVASLASLALLPLARRFAAGGGRSSRTLGILRLLPTLLATAVVGLWVLPGFVWHEPRETGERVTPAMAVLALAAGGFIASGPARGVRGLLATRRLVRRWRAGAEPMTLPGLGTRALLVDDPYPVVAAAGILRPRIYVARRVREVLTPVELVAVLRHEAAHLRRRDNLVRFLMRCCPDPIGSRRAGAEIERRFGAAAERESDAAVGGESRRLDLAAALVKVARLAEGRSFAPVAAAAFYGGDPIADRVRSLLAPAPPRPSPRRHPVGAFALGGSALLLAVVMPRLLPDLHNITERFVRFLQ